MTDQTMTVEQAPKTNPHVETQPTRLEGALVENLHSFLDLRLTTLERQKNLRSHEDQAFLNKFYEAKFAERNRRATEVESPEVGGWVGKIEKLFPYKTFGSLCVDGRVLPIVAFGFPGGFGGFLHLPGGNIEDFRQSRNDGLVLPKNSHFAHLLDDYYKKNSGQPLSQILDSHVGCAARKGQELRKKPSTEPVDSGLLEDVRRKKKIADAMKTYVETHHHRHEEILPVQFSYDPHTAFGYMGLETDEAMALAQERLQDYPQLREELQSKLLRNGKTEGQVAHELTFENIILKSLSREGKIISTELLAEEFKAIFSDHYFPIDWEQNYTESVEKFWDKLVEMIAEEEVLELIKDKVQAVYSREAMRDEELRQRSLLLLASSFNGYLQNRAGVVKDIHEEQCVVVQRQGHGPFSIDAFSVYPDEAMAENIGFTAGIVVDNRRTKRISDWTETYDNQNDFIDAPLPISIKFVVEQDFSDGQWQTLQGIEWNNGLLESWHQDTDDEFRNKLAQQVSDIPLALATGLNELRKKMIRVYNNPTTSDMIFNGHYEVIPLLVTRSRRIMYIPKFVHQGY